jgi:hypothetical protein
VIGVSSMLLPFQGFIRALPHIGRQRRINSAEKFTFVIFF